MKSITASPKEASALKCGDKRGWIRADAVLRSDGGRGAAVEKWGMCGNYSETRTGNLTNEVPVYARFRQLVMLQ